MKYFENTIKWITKEIDYDNLPPIAVLNPSPFYHNSPNLTLYIRKNNDMKLPHAVGEFTYLTQAFVYIIPLSELDENSFSTSHDFIKAFKFFKQYLANPNWKLYNFSNNEKRSIPITFKLTKI